MRSVKRIRWNASVRFLFLWGRLANFSFSVKAVESFRGVSSLPVIFSAHPRELSNQNRLQTSVFLICGLFWRDLHSWFTYSMVSVVIWERNMPQKRERGPVDGKISQMKWEEATGKPRSSVEAEWKVTCNQLSIVCLHDVSRHGREETGLFSAVTREVFDIFGHNLRRW